MSEPEGAFDGPGAILRDARQRQGLHIGVLAASLKVPQSRLEALEAGHFDRLPDATFTRALAQAVCRALKIDPAPVLAQLPGVRPVRLEKVDSGLNAPFRERPGSIVPGEQAPWRKPAPWVAGAGIVTAAAFVLLPAPDPKARRPVAAAAPAVAQAASPGATSALPAAVPAPSPVAVAPEDVPSPAAAVESSQGAVLSAVDTTWVQAVDGGGKVLHSGLLPAGESVELAGAPPLRLKIGNAAGTRVEYRGQRVDLTPVTRNNVATVELR
jgi:cytoskeleton protein RodZ